MDFLKNASPELIKYIYDLRVDLTYDESLRYDCLKNMSINYSFINLDIYRAPILKELYDLGLNGALSLLELFGLGLEDFDEDEIIITLEY